jgi:hypothetical protein
MPNLVVSNNVVIGYRNFLLLLHYHNIKLACVVMLAGKYCIQWNPSIRYKDTPK